MFRAASGQLKLNHSSSHNPHRPDVPDRRLHAVPHPDDRWIVVPTQMWVAIRPIGRVTKSSSSEPGGSATERQYKPSPQGPNIPRRAPTHPTNHWWHPCRASKRCIAILPTDRLTGSGPPPGGMVGALPVPLANAMDPLKDTEWLSSPPAGAPLRIPPGGNWSDNRCSVCP